MQYRSQIEDSGQDQIYYNCTMYNNSSGFLPAYFTETRSSPILMNPSEWYASILRFSIPGDGIPIFVAQAEQFPNTDPNKLIYTVELTNGLTGPSSGPINLYFNPEYNTTILPQIPVFTPVNPGQVPTDPYYYVYSYQYLVDLLNTALATAFVALQLNGGAVGLTEPPYFQINPTTQYVECVAEQGFYGSVQPQNPANVLIWFNEPMYYFFPSFLYIFNGFSGNKNQGLHIKDNYNNTVITHGGNTGYMMTSEWKPWFSWNDLQSISFRSASIPVISENVTGIISSGVDSLNGNISGDQINYLINFQPIFTGDKGSLREPLQYFATSEYTLSCMDGHTPLSTLDIGCYWSTNSGYSFQVYLPPKQVITLKILFRKKSFYNKKDNTNGIVNTPDIKRIDSNYGREDSNYGREDRNYGREDRNYGRR